METNASTSGSSAVTVENGSPEIITPLRKQTPGPGQDWMVKTATPAKCKVAPLFQCSNATADTQVTGENARTNEHATMKAATSSTVPQTLNSDPLPNASSASSETPPKGTEADNTSLNRFTEQQHRNPIKLVEETPMKPNAGTASCGHGEGSNGDHRLCTAQHWHDWPYLKNAKKSCRQVMHRFICACQTWLKAMWRFGDENVPKLLTSSDIARLF